MKKFVIALMLCLTVLTSIGVDFYCSDVAYAASEIKARGGFLGAGANKTMETLKKKNSSTTQKSSTVSKKKKNKTAKKSSTVSKPQNSNTQESSTSNFFSASSSSPKLQRFRELYRFLNTDIETLMNDVSSKKKYEYVKFLSRNFENYITYDDSQYGRYFHAIEDLLSFAKGADAYKFAQKYRLEKNPQSSYWNTQEILFENLERISWADQTLRKHISNAMSALNSKNISMFKESLTSALDGHIYSALSQGTQGIIWSGGSIKNISNALSVYGFFVVTEIAGILDEVSDYEKEVAKQNAAQEAALKEKREREKAQQRRDAETKKREQQENRRSNELDELEKELGL